MIRQRLKQLESLLPCIPILICAYIFLAADYYPGVSPEEVGLIWQECRISEDTYSDVSNETQVERCFGQPAGWAGVNAAPVAENLIHKFFLISAAQPYLLDGKPIFIGRMGVKYFVIFDGRKIGPTFNYIQLDPCCEDQLLVDAGQGHFVFRGVRHGQYYLVEISGTQRISSNTGASQ